MSINVIVDETSKGGQGAFLTRIVEIGRGTRGFGHKLRVRIERDSYDLQSHAKVEAWQGGWTEVYSLPSGHAKIRALPSYVKTAEVNAEMAKLADELITVAQDVLSPVA